MFISPPPGRPRTTNSLKSPRGVKIANTTGAGAAGHSARPGSHTITTSNNNGNNDRSNSHSHKRQAPWSANAADGQYAHHQQQQLREDMTGHLPTEDHGTAILKTEVVHSGRKIKFSIRQFAAPASFFSLQLRVSSTGQKWSMFVPIPELVQTLLRHWKTIQLEDENKLNLANWMIQFTKISFAPPPEQLLITGTSFNHEAFLQLCTAELNRVLFLMTVRLQRGARRFLHRLRVWRRSSGFQHQTISSEQKRTTSSHSSTPSSAQGQRQRGQALVKGKDAPPPPHSAPPLTSTAPLLAKPTFESLTKYAQAKQATPHSQRGQRPPAPHSAGHKKPRSAPMSGHKGAFRSHAPSPSPVSTNRDNLMFSEIVQLRDSSSPKFKTAERAVTGLEGLKFDVNGSFFDGYTPVNSGSIFLLKGSEEFPSLPSSAGGGDLSKPPLSQYAARSSGNMESDRSKRSRQQHHKGHALSTNIFSDDRRQAMELQKTADDFGFTPSIKDAELMEGFYDDDDNYADNVHEGQFNEENNANKNNTDLASLFDSRILSNDAVLPSSAPIPRKKGAKARAKVKKPSSAGVLSRKSKAVRGGDTIVSSRASTASSNSTEQSRQANHDAEAGSPGSIPSSPPHSTPPSREQPFSQDPAVLLSRKKMTRRVQQVKVSSGLHVPVAKRVGTIKEEREVRRLENEMEDMKREMTALRRKVRTRDKRIRDITPVYLQPKNEKYRIAAHILQPVIRAHQQKKFFKMKSLELHAELKESDDGGFVEEALRIGLMSGNVAMATDAIRRSFEVVSALNDTSKHQHLHQQWHGIKFIPTNYSDVHLICQVIQAFVSIEEIATFGLQLLSLISALQDFPDRFEVMGASGVCDVVLVVLSRYCEDTVMCANALKLCKRLTKSNLANRQRCISVSHCRSFCTLLLRQMNVIHVLEKTILLIRSFCIDVSEAIGTFHRVGLFDNLTYCMRTHKTSILFSEFCKTITTICCKEGGSNLQIRRDFGTRANCLIYIDGLVANQYDDQAFKHVAVMIVCICENNKEGFENMVTDHLLTSLSNIMHGEDISSKTRKNTFDLIYNLIRNCPEDKSTRKIYHKLEILLSQEEEDERDEDMTTNFEQHSFSQERGSLVLHDSFLEIGLGTMMEDSLLKPEEEQEQEQYERVGDRDGGGRSHGQQVGFMDAGVGADEGDNRSVVTFEHQVKDLNPHSDDKDRDRTNSLENTLTTKTAGFGPPSSESKFNKSLNHEQDLNNSVNESSLSFVRNIRESILTLFNDASVQNDLHFDESRTFITDVENLVATLSYSEHFKDILLARDSKGKEAELLCVLLSLVIILGSPLAPPAVLEADTLLLGYFLEKQPVQLLAHLPTIEQALQHRLWGTVEGEKEGAVGRHSQSQLPAHLKFKLASFRLSIRLKEREMQDKGLHHSASETEFLCLVDECTTYDQISRFMSNSMEESHSALALQALRRAHSLVLMAQQEIQDDPPAQADLALQLTMAAEGMQAQAETQAPGLLLVTMMFFASVPEIQSQGLDVIVHLCSTDSAAAGSFGRQGAVEVLNTLVWGHVLSMEVCGKFLDCALLLTTLKNAATRRRAATKETLDIVKNIMASHLTDKRIILKCCRYVTQLSLESESVRLMVLSSGINEHMLKYLEQQEDACDEDIAEVFNRTAITLCTDRLEDQIRFFSSSDCITLYMTIMKKDSSRKKPISGHFCRLFVVLTEPGHGFVIESLQQSDFAVELQRLVADSLRFNVPAMLSCLRFLYFVCQAAPDFRHRLHAVGITELLLSFLQANSNNSDAIISSTHTLLSLCDNTPNNLFTVMSHTNIFDFARILRNNASSGKICKSVCAMLVKLSSGGEKAIQTEFASSGIAPELALALEHKKLHPDGAQAVLLLVIHLVNVVSVLGPELISAEVPTLITRFSAQSKEQWPAKLHDLAKLTRDALVHDDDVKYDLLHSSGTSSTRIDMLYVHQNIIEYSESASDSSQLLTELSISEVGILLKEVKSQKDVEFITGKLVNIADEGDIKLCLKTFKTINIAIDSIGDNKMHFLLARTLVENPHLICGAMASCLQTAEVQTFGFNIIKLLPFYLEGKHDFGEHGECDLLLLAMRRHIGNSSLCESGLECAAVLAAARYENKKHFGKLDGLRCLRVFIDHWVQAHRTPPVVLTKCFQLVVTLCSGCTEIQDAVRTSGFLVYLLTFLGAHQADEDAVHCCSEVLFGLFAQGNQDNCALLAARTSIDLYLEVLGNNVTSTITCTAMSRLIMAITNESNDHIVNVLLDSNASQCLMQALLNGSTNGIITKVIKLVTLLIVYFICNFPPMRSQFLQDDFLVHFHSMAQSPKTNEQISKSIQVALKKLNKLQSKQNLNSALNYIDKRKDDARKKVAAKRIGRRATLFLMNRRRYKVRREAEDRLLALTQEMDELSFFHEFHEALSLAVKWVQPSVARDTLRRLTCALQECGEVSSKSPLGSSFLQNLEVIFNVMSAFLSFEDIQMAAIDVFHCLSFSPDEYQNFGEKGGFALVLPLLQRHISNSNICFGLLKCTGVYLQDETGLNRDICGEDKKQLKVISKIISVYMENSDNTELRDEFRSVIYFFLQNLCFKSPLIKNKICEIGITDQLTKYMLNNARDAATVTSTCATLISLCDGGHQKNLSVVMSHNNILGFVRIIRDHSSSFKICKSVTAMLVKLSSGGEKAIQSELSKSGIATELSGVLSDFRTSSPSPSPKVEWTVIMLILHLVCNISAMTNEFIAANMAPQLEHYLTPEAEKTWDLPLRQSADMALRKLRKHVKMQLLEAGGGSMHVASASKRVSSP